MVKQFTCPVNCSIILQWGLLLPPHRFYFSGKIFSFSSKKCMVLLVQLFFSTEITYPKINSFIYHDFFHISTEEVTETKHRHWTGPIDQSMFSSGSYPNPDGNRFLPSVVLSLFFGLPHFTLTHTIRAVF